MSEYLLLLRHGQVALAHFGRMLGATDVPLAPRGREQVKTLAGRLQRWAPLSCWSSPMTRCRETALSLLPEQAIQWDDDLREIDFGQWENRTFAEAAAKRPDLVEQWTAFAPDFAFPGGERLQGFLARVRRAADRLAAEEASTVLAVTHGGVIRAMLCHLLGLEPRQYVAFDIGYASLAVVRLFDGRGVLTALERCEFGGPAPDDAASAAQEARHG